jgi:hypothetical protein
MMMGMPIMPPRYAVVNTGAGITYYGSNLHTSTGSLPEQCNVELNIISTSVMGSTSASIPALTVGPFNTGSIIIVSNAGSIIGYNGANGANGGMGTYGNGGNGGAGEGLSVFNYMANFSGPTAGGNGTSGTGGSSGASGGSGGTALAAAAGPLVLYTSTGGFIQGGYGGTGGAGGLGLQGGSGGGGGGRMGVAPATTGPGGSIAYWGGGGGGAGGGTYPGAVGVGGGSGYYMNINGYYYTNTVGTSGSNGTIGAIITYPNSGYTWYAGGNEGAGGVPPSYQSATYAGQQGGWCNGPGNNGAAANGGGPFFGNYYGGILYGAAGGLMGSSGATGVAGANGSNGYAITGINNIKILVSGTIIGSTL